MNEVSVLQSLGQVSASQTPESFRGFLRGHVREMSCEVMAAEVTELCGLKHSPSPSDHYRAGSSPGRVLAEGERDEVVRPRVHRKGEDGSSREVELATYRLAKDPAQLQVQVIQAIIAGVSGRSMQDLKPKSPGVNAKEVFGELAAFLKRINAEAYRSLQEAGDALLALHRLNVPNTLHRSLLSTNAIENTFLNTRRKLGRVTRFRAETDQASRWLSHALLEAERGFRKIVGCDLLPSLITALGRPPVPSS
jgi:transposase-like protein